MARLRFQCEEGVMGFSLSFLAVKGAMPAEIHRALEVTDTGVASTDDDYPAPSVRGAALPDGWYLVLLNDVAHRLISSEEIAERLSQGCEAITCQVEEHDMYSACFGLRDGTHVWSVVHDSRKARDDLEVRGEPPAVFGEISARMRAKQAEEDRRTRKVSVDLLFDIPVELAHALCGYRHDMIAGWGEPAFTVLAEGELGPGKT
jgi:hypothetical protein